MCIFMYTYCRLCMKDIGNDIDNNNNITNNSNNNNSSSNSIIPQMSLDSGYSIHSEG